LFSCINEEGEGGTGSIEGYVYKVVHPDGVYNFKTDTFPASKEDVYIVYGSDAVYGDKMDAHYDGFFKFKYLTKGIYQIYSYSSHPGGIRVPVIDTVILGSGETKRTRDIYIHEGKSLDKSYIKGQVLVNYYDDGQLIAYQQTGAGITPILGVNLSPAEGLNIGIKYEFKTFMTLTNETTKDDTGLFPDKAKSGSDIPAILAIGADYKFSDKLNVQLSYNTYFDKNVDWGNNVYQQKRTIDNNYWEIALGAQYAISDNFAISAGVMHSNTGVSEDYQSDFSYSNDSYSGGLGFEWKLSKKLTFDAGAMMTKYIDYEKSFDGYKETYGKSNVLFALGLSYSIF
jgi:hypothetical protein